MPDNDRDALARGLYEALAMDGLSERHDAPYVGRLYDIGPDAYRVVVNGNVDLRVLVDHLLARWRLVPIPPPQPPVKFVLPELARDAGKQQCDARDESGRWVCQRPLFHPDRHFAIKGDNYITFLTKRDIEMIEQATAPTDLW